MTAALNPTAPRLFHGDEVLRRVLNQQAFSEHYTTCPDCHGEREGCALCLDTGKVSKAQLAFGERA